MQASIVMASNSQSKKMLLIIYQNEPNFRKKRGQKWRKSFEKQLFLLPSFLKSPAKRKISYIFIHSLEFCAKNHLCLNIKTISKNNWTGYVLFTMRITVWLEAAL